MFPLISMMGSPGSAEFVAPTSRLRPSSFKTERSRHPYLSRARESRSAPVHLRVHHPNAGVALPSTGPLWCSQHRPDSSESSTTSSNFCWAGEKSAIGSLQSPNDISIGPIVIEQFADVDGDNNLQLLGPFDNALDSTRSVKEHSRLKTMRKSLLGSRIVRY
jgi:hypothetical protein